VLVLETVKGTIEIELFAADAPKSVARIVELANKRFYRGQRFHWVQPGVVQFGDPLSRDMSKENLWGSGGSGPQNSNRAIGVVEINKRRFERGTVGYAYRNGWKAESADSQMFILTGPNPALNGKYVALGRVTKGMDVVEKIQKADIIKTVSLK
jgi:cyclophilin family peptidyl-prolyl cis-trans isomerase